MLYVVKTVFRLTLNTILVYGMCTKYEAGVSILISINY